MTYIIAYVKTQKIRFIIHYVKPTAQLLFRIRVPKGGPTCRRQVVNPRHQTSQGQSVAKPETPLQNIQVEPVIPYICEMHCPANVIMMVAVVLAPKRHQCIANHHRDPSSISGFTSSHQHNIHIPLRPLNKQYLREVGSSATCCWQWVRLLTRIMPCHQFMLSTHHSHS